MKRACIFCASSPKIPQVYFNDAQQLTNLLADNNYGIVYGGGSIGLMGTVADTALARGVEVIGVIPQFMVDVEWQHKGVTDMRLTTTMAQRKQMLIELSDTIIILPGSTGTMDELFDAMADKKLGLLWKPIVILNTNHFYDNLKAQLETMVKEHFMNDKHLRTVYFAQTPQDAMAYILKGDDENDHTTLIDAAVN